MGKATTEWRRSSFCADSACVEVAAVDGGVAMRDGKNPEAGSIWFSKPDWAAFLERVGAGDKRLP